MRPNSAVRNNESVLHRHRSTQFIHNLSSCLSLAMSNRFSRRPNVWSENGINHRFAPRISNSNQSRNPLQSLSPILNSSDTYICCSYSPRCFIIQKVKPSTLASSLCTTSTNSCESATNSIQTTHLLRAKRCTNHDRNKIGANALDTEEIPQKVEKIYKNDCKITDNKLTVSQTTTSLNESQQKNVCNTSSAEKYTKMISNSNTQIKTNECVVNCLNEESLEKNFRQNQLNNQMSSKSGDELRRALQQQLEYYFSRENLSRDNYLISQMDSDQYVPIAIIANFDQIKRLTDDKQLVVDVLRQSPSVQVDETGERVRPIHKRCVLILREIPDSAVAKDIENLFSGENCPKFVGCEFAHNQSWYVTFETDEDAQRAYRYIREEIRVFPTTGKPIMARIKAKPIVHAVSTAYNNKNGFRPTVGPSVGISSVPQNSANNGISNTSTDSFSSQPLLSQQTFTYANVPTVNFNSRIYTPFYPPSMLQAWTPTTSACYDLSTVFVANGLAPHAYGTAVRPNYHSSKSSSVRNANTNSKPHISRKPHFSSNSTSSSVSPNNVNINSNNNTSNGSNSSNGTISPANGSANISTNSSTNGSINGSVTSSDYIANNSHYINAKHYSIPKTCISMTTPKESPANPCVVNTSGAVDDISVPPFTNKSDGSAQSPNGSSKCQLSQSVDQSNGNRSNSPLTNTFGVHKNRENRGRIRKRKEDNIHENNTQSSDISSVVKTTSKVVTLSAANTQPFELMANSFPPLPSSAIICSNDDKDSEECATNQCSSLADVVKGTVKQKNDKNETKSWFDSTNISFNGSKSESNPSNCGTGSINNTNSTLCQKLSKDRINCSKGDAINNTEDNVLSNNLNENLMEKETNWNSKVSQTSHESDHCHSNAIPAITSKHYPSETSSSCFGSNLSPLDPLEKSNAMSTPIVLNGINDSFSINSDSFDENISHSSASANHTEPSSPNSVPKHLEHPFETNSIECNGNIDQNNDDINSLDESTDSGNCEPGVKRLTYAEMALRSAKDKLNQNSEPNSVSKDKESSNSPTPLKTSTQLSTHSSRLKLKTVIDLKESRAENGPNRSFYRNKESRHSHDVHERTITSKVK